MSSVASSIWSSTAMARPSRPRSPPCRSGRTAHFAGVQGTVRDVHPARSVSRRELRESQDRYRFLVENSPDVVFSSDADGRFTFMSESMERMTGWRPDELIGTHFSRVVEAGSLPEAGMRLGPALEADPTSEQVAHINLEGPDGRIVPVEVSGRSG